MPGGATYTCKDEIAHLQTWAAGNKLKLNREKTKEIIFPARRKGALPLSGIERVPSVRVLGVTVNDKLTAADHVATLLSSGTSLLYAMRVLRSHGTPPSSLHDIFRARVVSRIQYVAPAWSGMCSAADRTRLVSLLRRSKRSGVVSGTTVRALVLGRFGPKKLIIEDNAKKMNKNISFYKGVMLCQFGPPMSALGLQDS